MIRGLSGMKAVGLTRSLVNPTIARNLWIGTSGSASEYRPSVLEQHVPVPIGESSPDRSVCLKKQALIVPCLGLEVQAGRCELRPV